MPTQDLRAGADKMENTNKMTELVISDKQGHLFRCKLGQ